MTPAQALIALAAHPRKFLESHHVMAYAGIPATFSAQQHQFGSGGYVDALGMVGPAGGSVFNRTAGTAKSFGPIGGTGKRAFAFCPPGSMQAGLVAPIAQASVMNVPVVPSASLHGNYVGIALNDLGGVVRDFAVTTLLNGCSYVIDGANPSVTHIQPTGGDSSAHVRNQLHGNYVIVYGGGGNEYDHNTEDVTIIGVRRGVGWKIYAQVHTRNVKDIVRVTKLFG